MQNEQKSNKKPLPQGNGFHLYFFLLLSTCDIINPLNNSQPHINANCSFILEAFEGAYLSSVVILQLNNHTFMIAVTMQAQTLCLSNRESPVLSYIRTLVFSDTLIFSAAWLNSKSLFPSSPVPASPRSQHTDYERDY